MTVPLGPFDLHAPCGQGGMGEVWRGVHRGQGVPVAVKVVRHRLREDPRFLSAFQDEVRQVARLDHPGVVLVLDYGRVPTETETATRGQLTAGSPYLVMEYAGGGTLEQRPSPRRWEEVRVTLLAVLDALAHAHARGVLHRDLKPANLLVGADGPRASGPKLSDFGLAHALHEAHVATGFEGAGTPEFMAPEQVRGAWRDQGPWTDLYALGCLGWWLLTGDAPFAGADRRAVAEAHLYAPLPTLRPGVTCPDGVEAWLQTLLAKDPDRRPRSAAAAAAALGELAASPTAVPGPLWYSLPPAGPSGLGLLDEPPDEAPLTDAPAPAPAGIPPTWRAEEVPAQPPPLLGAGLGLYDLRAVPLVGRIPERDALWEDLRGVAASGKPRVVVLEGAAGVGKSHLARWLTERAGEVGAATPLWTGFSPSTAPGQGLARLLARHLRCTGLEGAPLDERLADLCARGWLGSPAEADALGELLRAEAGPSLLRPDERRRMIAHSVERLAGEGPVIVLLDDVQWSADALRFVTHLLTVRSGPLPVLVVLTVRPDALATRPDEAAALDALRARPDVRTLPIGPLAAEEQRALIGRLLVLGDALASTVGRRAGGNPMFAVELVRDWVHREVLVAGPDGFTLRAGEPAGIPDELHALWLDRLRGALAGAAPAARDAVAVAAALGAEVRDGEWRAACAALGGAVSDGLVDGLLRAHLVEAREAGWAFSHALLRESVTRAAQEEGRWPAVNRACADVLSGRPGAAARVGRHRLAAEELAAAIDPLLAGADEQIRAGEFAEALALVALAEGALDGAGIGAGDLRRGIAQVARVRAWIEQGHLELTDREATRCAEAARRHRWPAILAKALRYRGMVALKQGDLSLAEAMLAQAEGQARRAGDREEEAAALEHQGTLFRMRGDGAGSVETLERARAIYAALGDRVRLADCLKELGGTRVTMGEGDLAEPLLREALALYEALGHTPGRAGCLNNLGEVLRQREELGGAARAYEEAHALLTAIGAQKRAIPLLNLGLVQLRQEEWDRARRTLSEARDLAARTGRRVVHVLANVGLLACAAHARRWDDWDPAATAAAEELAETGLVEPDIAGLCALAATLAAAAGEADRARAVRALAVTQLRELGRHAEADALEGGATEARA